jgi:hypothetical protein
MVGEPTEPSDRHLDRRAFMSGRHPSDSLRLET